MQWTGRDPSQPRVKQGPAGLLGTAVRPPFPTETEAGHWPHSPAEPALFLCKLLCGSGRSLPLPIYNFSEKRLRNNLENALEMRQQSGSHSPLTLPDLSTSSVCLEIGPNVPQPPSPRSAPPETWPLPCAFPPPRQGKGTELKAGFAELPSVRQVTALRPWRRKPRWGSGRVSGARAKLRTP